MRVPYFFDRLNGLPSFDGFVARWYIPGEKLIFQATNTTAITTVMVIDTAHEIKVGVGFDWKPVVLGSDQMQVSDSIMKLMGANFGDRIAIPLDFSGYFGDSAKAKLFSLMLAGLDGADIDFKSNKMRYGDSVIPLEMFGIDPADFIIDLTYTLTASYEKPNGKFSLIFSESAIVDCHYIFSSFLVSIEVKLGEIESKYPEIYKKAVVVVEDIRTWIETR